jgi:hypothetical protein
MDDLVLMLEVTHRYVTKIVTSLPPRLVFCFIIHPIILNCKVLFRDIKS